jgi:hypothetical protein
MHSANQDVSYGDLLKYALVAKKREGSNSSQQNDLWVAPKYSLKGPTGERAWDSRPSGPPSHSRFLELADIALGLKRKEPIKRRKTPIHQANKTEPYSR